MKRRGIRTLSRPILHHPESRAFSDPQTGAGIRQVTDHPSIHHHPFYYLPAYDDAMTRLFFVSHRTGRPEVWCEILSTGELQQLSDQPDLGEWSVHPSHNGRHVYFKAGQGAWRIATDGSGAELIVDFGAIIGGSAASGGSGIRVGAAMGTTSLSRDDRYWAVPVKSGELYQLFIIDTESGKFDLILARDLIGHPEFHPADNAILRYAGPFQHRIWVIRRDGSDHRQIYQRKDREWIVHETWNPACPDTASGEKGLEIITANWPQGCLGIDVRSGAVRKICDFNAWHPAINRQGTLMCSDTTFPDIGLQLFDPRQDASRSRTLCFPGASNEGRHWNTDHCPYDDEDYRQGKWKVHAPQHTHPHPSFSPDGRRVVFTSDRTGWSQVYEVEVPR